MIARNRSAFRNDFLHQAAKCFGWTKLKENICMIPVPHGKSAFVPCNGIFVKINDKSANFFLVFRVKTGGDIGNNRNPGVMHFQGFKPADGKIAQYAHGRIMKSKGNIDHQGRDSLPSQAFAGRHKIWFWPTKNKLLFCIAIGKGKGWPLGQSGVDNALFCVHSEHAGFICRFLFQLGNMLGPFFKQQPCRFFIIYACKT